jgi:hypothetical protein
MSLSDRERALSVARAIAADGDGAVPTPPAWIGVEGADESAGAVAAMERNQRAADALWGDPVFLRRYAEVIEDAQNGVLPKGLVNREELEALFESRPVPSEAEAVALARIQRRLLTLRLYVSTHDDALENRANWFAGIDDALEIVADEQLDDAPRPETREGSPK